MLRRERYQGAKCYSKQNVPGSRVFQEAKYTEEGVTCSKEQTGLRGKAFQGAICVEEQNIL